MSLRSGPAPTPVMTRIMNRVERGPACWRWLGTHSDAGRAKVGIGSLSDGTRRMEYVARIALADRLGRPLGAGMYACHSCDNPGCVNPDHLFEGTAEDNSADMAQKGRSQQGARHWRAKLSRDDVQQIREASGTCEEIAARFGVSAGHVGNIRRGGRWGRVA